MGQMSRGQWQAEPGPGGALRSGGAWERTPSVLRNWVTPAGAFPVEAGRYHLYAAWNCPWAHRVLLGRAILGLEDALPVSFVTPRRTSDGWVFGEDPGFQDNLHGAAALHEVYAHGCPDYTGRVTVPLLYDSVTDTLVSNESADILRMLATVFLPLSRLPKGLVPDAQRDDIDALNATLHDGLNNAVYRAGFAETQEAYEVAVGTVFETLDMLEDRLADRQWLMGNDLTEPDIRLFPTLARFDVAYHTAFRCSRRRLVDYPRLWEYARSLYALPGVADTVNFDIYRRGYFSPSPKRNPLGIVPVAPDISWAL